MEGSTSNGNRSIAVDEHYVNIWEDPILQIFVENLDLGGEVRKMSEKDKFLRDHASWVLEEEMEDINLQIFWSDCMGFINETSSLPSTRLPYINSNMEERQSGPSPLPPPPTHHHHEKSSKEPCIKWDGKVESEADKVGEKEEQRPMIEDGEQAIMIIMKSKVDVIDDGYSWRKYGEKNIKKRMYPRSYYRCGHNGCKIQKRVERSTQNPSNVLISYYGRHIHHPQQ